MEPLSLIFVEALIHGVLEMHRENDDLPDTVLRTPDKGYTLPFLSFPVLSSARVKRVRCVLVWHRKSLTSKV